MKVGRRRGYARNCASGSPARRSRIPLLTIAPSAITSPRMDGEGGRAPASFPQRLNLNFNIAQHLRYGENPHQQAAFYREPVPVPGSLASYTQLQGKELSYNNIADADAAWECVKTFDAACLRHHQACQSLRRGRGRYTAWRLQAGLCHRSRHPPSAASSLSTASLDGTAAEAVIKQFVEVIIAPQFTAEAQQILARKANVRVLTVPFADGQQCFRLQARGRRVAGADAR